MVDSRQKRTTRRENPVPTSSKNQKPEGKGTCGPQTDRTTPGRLNEMAAGGMASLLMTQPVLWPGVVAGFWQTNPGAFGKFALWPTRRARTRTKTRALWSFHFFSL